MIQRILLAVDESPASERAARYVGEMIGGHPEHYVHLVHVLPATHSASEEEARALLTALRQHFVSRGVKAGDIDEGILSVPSDASISDGILDIARDQECETIAVGRNALPWYKETFHHHPADELVKKAKGFTLWIVE